MEKKRLNDQCSSSARCAFKRTMRICFAVITILLLSLSIVVPAFAYAIDVAEREKAATVLSGDVTYTLSPSSDDVSSTVSVTHSIGGLLPMPSGSGEYFGQDFTDYLLSLTNDPEWKLSTEYRLSRSTRLISNINFASYGYNVKTVEDTVDGITRLPYQEIQYNFNSYMFNGNYDESVFNWLLRLKLNRPCEVTTRVVFTRAMEGQVSFFSYVVEDTYVSNASPSLPDSYHPFEKASQTISSYVPKNGSVLIEEMIVTVRPTTVQNIISTGFELLGSNWIASIPQYVPVDNNLNYDPLGYTFSNFYHYLGDFYYRIDIPDTPVIDSEFGSQFTSFLAGAVSGFFDVEIMPGFSLGGVIAAIIAVVIVLLLLKFFSGG